MQEAPSLPEKTEGNTYSSISRLIDNFVLYSEEIDTRNPAGRDCHSPRCLMSKQPSIELTQDTDTDFQTQKSVRCKNCGHAITNASFAIQPHEHTFRNPAGYSFHVLCYSDAPGASEAGSPTTEACWFPGYSWTFAICQGCHNHLGWWYHGTDSFAGLIATRLVR